MQDFPNDAPAFGGLCRCQFNKLILFVNILLTLKISFYRVLPLNLLLAMSKVIDTFLHLLDFM